MVTQANQVALASYSLTLEEKRLILFLTSLINQNDEDFKVYRIPITDIMEFLDVKGKAFYERLRKIARTLRSRPLSIEKPNGGWIESGWISKAEYKPKGEDGLEYSCLDLRFDPDMKPYLLQLKSQFFSYMLENVASLKSIYSIRFYEIFASYRRLGKVTLEVEDIKSRLQISDKYKRFKDFRSRVIMPAQKELKEKTDIYFEYTEERQGRRVARIHFTIYSQSNSQDLKETEKPQINHQPKEAKPQKQITSTSTQLEADRALERNGVDQAGRKYLLNNFDPDKIIENANIVLEKHKDGKVNNLAASTVSSIKNDWRPKSSPFEKEQEEKKQEAIKKNQEKEEEKNKLEILQKEFEVEKKKKIDQAFSVMEKETEEELISDFKKSPIFNGFVSEFYKKDGMKSPLVKALFNRFVAERTLKKEEYDFIEWARIKKKLNIESDRFDNYRIVK